MKLNSRIYVLAVFIISLIAYAGFLVYKYMLSPPPKNYNFLKVGDKAPNFKSKFICNNTKSNYKETKLYDLLKKNNIILYFYPKDGTKYCTMEAQSFIRHYKNLKNMGYEVLGISSDNLQSHEQFIRDLKIPYKLICDSHYNIHKKYGACSEKDFLGRKTYRITFVIEKETGTLTQVITKVKSKTHAMQIIENHKKLIKS